MAELTEKEILAKNKALRETIALMEREAAAEKALDEARGNKKTDLQREIDLLEKKTKAYRQADELVTSLLESAEIEAELLDDKLTKEQLLATVRQDAIEQLTELQKLKEDGEKIDEAKIKNLQLILEASEKGVEGLKQFQETARAGGDMNAQMLGASKAGEALGDQFDKTAKSILGVSAEWNQAGLTGRVLDLVNKSESVEDLSKGFAAVGSKIKDTLSPTNLLGSAITKLVSASWEMTKALDSSFAEFNQTTGGGQEYMGVISDVTSENYAFGISSDEAMQSVSALYNELAMFTSLSKEAQAEIADVSSKLQVMGVDARTTAKTADILMQSVGYTKDEFVTFQQNLKSMSNAIKVPMATLSSQFVDAADIIGKYGKKGEEEFIKLAAAAKATGIEMRSLLDIAGQFDTFEDAAERVGQLNAILGGSYFDTMQMVNATEEERIDLLRRGVQASGKTFDDLGRYEKKAIAAAAGINDINEANKLFGKSTVAYEELQNLAADASTGLADLSEEAFNTLSPMQKLQAAFKKFQKPLDTVLKMIDILGGWLYTIVDLWEKLWKELGVTGEGFTYVNMTILLVFFSLKKLGLIAKASGAIMGALASKFPILAKGMGALGKKTGGLAKPLGAIGRAASRNVKGFVALGAAALMLGAGIALAAVGFAELVKSFKGLSGGEIVGALIAITIVMGGMILVILALGKVSLAAAAPTWAFAGAILAIGAAVALAAYGMSLLVDSFAGLLDSFASIPMENILAFMGAVFTLATLGILAGVGLGAIAVGLLAIGAALIFIRDEEINLLAKLFQGIGSVTTEASQAIVDLARNLGNLTGVQIPVELQTIMEQMAELPDSGGIEHAATFVKAVSKTTPENAKAAEGVIKEAAKLAAIKVEAGSSELLDALSKLIKVSSDGFQAGAQSANQLVTQQITNNQKPFEIVVNIDGKKAWKGVRTYYTRELEGG